MVTSILLALECGFDLNSDKLNFQNDGVAYKTNITVDDQIKTRFVNVIYFDDFRGEYRLSDFGEKYIGWVYILPTVYEESVRYLTDINNTSMLFNKIKILKELSK